MTTHTQGDRVYSRSGHEGEYVGKIENGLYLVRPVLECYRGDEEYTELGHLQEWEEVFDRAPVEKIDAELAKRQQELNELLDTIAYVRQELRDEKDETEARMNRLKQHEGLQLLDDILAKKFTHYIVTGFCDAPKIVPVEETLVDESGSRYDKKLKLLSLYGNIRTGKVEWKLSYYSDGSGGSNDALVFMSYEQAMEGMGKLIERRWEQFWADTSRDGGGNRIIGYVGKWVEAADKYGFPVPVEIREEIRMSRLRNAEYNLEKAKSNLAEWQATFDSVSAPILPA